MEITYCFKNRDASNKFVAEFGVKIPEWDLNFSKMKLIRTLNGNFFVAGPSYKAKDKDGNEAYKDYWFFGKEASRRFKDTALKLIQEHIEKMPKGNQDVIPYTEDLF